MPEFDAKTQEVLNWFEKITHIPRCSKNEGKIKKWLLDWAAENSFESKEDEAGNVVIKVPGTPGYENSPIAVLQGHMDMVCEKTPDSTHNFETDPLELVFDGDWLKANKTTLGADNGIAIAMAMAVALDPEVERPPLELLITVDEETGLTGANALQPGFIDGKTLLNLDSEDEGVFTIGCAGGIDTDIHVPLAFEDVPAGMNAFTVKVGGLKGGHSGVEIHEQRGNAIKVLFRTLTAIAAKHDLRIADVKGGSAHNAIPRDAEATVLLNPADLDSARNIAAEMQSTILHEISRIDPGITISVEDGTTAVRTMTADGTKKTLDLLHALPHGVNSYSMVIDGLVETSNNLATVAIGGDTIKVLSSQRSSLVSRLMALTEQLHAVANLAGGTAHNGDGYPPWEANWDSPLLAKCKQVYQDNFGKEPVVEVIHAGLECGIIGDKNPGMDMISFGPTIKNPHSPDECMKISDIKKIWDFMVVLFKALK